MERTANYSSRPTAAQSRPRLQSPCAAPRQWRSSPPWQRCPRRCFFDVFGTLVDWRTSIAREARGDPRAARPFARLARLRRRLARRVSAGDGRNPLRPACRSAKLDVLHRRNLEKILPRFKVAGLPEDDHAPPQSRLAPARRLAGFSAGSGAPEAQMHDRAGVERQHLADGRAGAPQQLSLGRDPGLRDRRRLQAQAAGLSRGLRGARSAARRLHDGGGAFQRSRRRGEERAAHRAHRAAERARTREGRGRADRAGRCRGRQSGRSGAASWDC